jgi:hypothetical protein
MNLELGESYHCAYRMAGVALWASITRCTDALIHGSRTNIDGREAAMGVSGITRPTRRRTRQTFSLLSVTIPVEGSNATLAKTGTGVVGSDGAHIAYVVRHGIAGVSRAISRLALAISGSDGTRG